MSIDIMGKAWKKSRQSGARLLALLALADRADEDGICWPGREWIAERARVQPGKNIRRIIRSLEEAGEIVYDPGQGRGRRTYYLVAIALEPEEIKEIAMRRFQMTEEEATSFVEEIISRQIQYRLKNASKDTPPEKKGAEEPPFDKKEGRGAPFSKKGAAEPPFGKKGGRRAREKGAVEPAKRGPWSPPDPSIDPSVDPSRENIPSLVSSNKHHQDRINDQGPHDERIGGGGGDDDFSIWDAFRLAGIRTRTARRIPEAWKRATGKDLTPEDILAWHFYREAENLNLPAGRKLRVGFVVASLESGERADEQFYERAREYLHERALDAAYEHAEVPLMVDEEPAPDEGEDSHAIRAIHEALETYLPPIAEVGIDAFDAMRAALPEIARDLHARGIDAEDITDLRLYLAYQDREIPPPDGILDVFTEVTPEFYDWQERKREAWKMWTIVLQQLDLPQGSVVGRLINDVQPVDLNGALILRAPEAFAAWFARLWEVRGPWILSRHTAYPEDLPIQFIPHET